MTSCRRALQKIPVWGIAEALDLTFSRINFEASDGWTDKEYACLLEALALLTELNEAQIFTAPTYAPDISGTRDDDCGTVVKYLREVQTICESEKGKLQFSALRSRLGNVLRTTFSYEFTEGDLSRIQVLLNELRELISDSPRFEASHQRRLLGRLEKLQVEMHKRVGDLDKFWGLVGDAGVALGKFGTDAEPIFDRVREITGIVWRTQARAEELPSDAPQPLLSAPDDMDGGSN
jgi:hypothetical protein